MGLNLKHYFLAFIAFAGVYETVCQTACKTDRCETGSTHACASENTFIRCDVRGTPVVPEKIFTCPVGFSCVKTNDRCAETATPACQSQCSICDTTTHTACLTKKEFAFCIKGEPVLSMKDTCGDLNCLASDPEICVAATVPPSCNQDTPNVPTEPTPTGDPTTEQVRERCRAAGKMGKFSSGNCKKYLYCFIRAGEYSGNIYTCPGTTQFNCKTQQCELTCDTNCPTV